MTPAETASFSTETIGLVAAVGRLVEVTDGELARYAELIYRRTGIRVAPQKKTLLSNRVRRRLRETGIDSYGAYYQHLKRLRPSDPEWGAFLQEITTHETYLFRDEGHWDWLRNVYLPQVAAEARSGSRPRRLRVWSAACSTGDEPFTAACCIADSLANHQQFFKKAAGAGVWQAKPVLTRMVAFRHHNLLDPLREMPFDLVFVKNVLIYFDRASKRRVMDNVRAAVRPGGLLVAGAAEGIGELLKDYARVQSWLYRRSEQ